MQKSIYSKKRLSIKELMQMQDSGKKYIFGKTNNDGFPINSVLQGVAYIVAASLNKVNGKRVKGNYQELLLKNESADFIIEVPNRGTCLKIYNDKFSALVGYINDSFNKTPYRKKRRPKSIY